MDNDGGNNGDDDDNDGSDGEGVASRIIACLVVGEHG